MFIRWMHAIVHVPLQRQTLFGAMDTSTVPGPTTPDVEMNGAALAEPKPHRPLPIPHRNIQLTVFREIVGINPTPALELQDATRPAENKGLYRRTCQAESKARLQYYVCAATFNTCFLLQIVVAAALTALGAANGPHLAVTVLGAVNTVIAGILTYLKGQGLPNRLRQYQSELRKVREYIEERERDFSRLDCQLDLDDEIAMIYRMYEAVRQNQEDNLPDIYHNFAGSDGTKPTGTPGAQTPAKQVDAIPDEAAKANGHQMEVTTTEVYPGLSDRSSNRNSLHIPVGATGTPTPKPQDIMGEYSSTQRKTGMDERSSSLDIEPAANRNLTAPYTGLRHVNGEISSEQRTSSVGRSPNRHSRSASTDRPPPSRERPNSMTGRRAPTEIVARPRDLSSRRSSAYTHVEWPTASNGGSSTRNSGYEHALTEPPVAITPSRRSSNRNSTYIAAEQSTVPNEITASARTEHIHNERRTAPTPSGRSSNRNNAYTEPDQPPVPNESIPRLHIRNPPTDTDSAPSEGSESGHARLAALNRRNSTTPVKQFLSAAQRRL